MVVRGGIFESSVGLQFGMLWQVRLMWWLEAEVMV